MSYITVLGACRVAWGSIQRRKCKLAFWRWVFYVKALSLGEPTKVFLPAWAPGPVFWKGMKGSLLASHKGRLICSL